VNGTVPRHVQGIRVGLRVCWVRDTAPHGHKKRCGKPPEDEDNWAVPGPIVLWLIPSELPGEWT
jgi:hypothetical protein